MLLIRVSLLLMVAVISMTWCSTAGTERKNDRMDDLLSLMHNMGKRVDSLTESVEKIYRMEEETAEHMSKTEDRVEELVQHEGNMVKKMDNMESQMGQMKAQMKTQMGEMEQKMDV